jgi:hypothetical protein
MAKRAEQELLDVTEPPAPADPEEEPAKTGGMAIEYPRWRASARKAHLTVAGPGDITTVPLVANYWRCRGGALATEALGRRSSSFQRRHRADLLAGARRVRRFQGEAQGRDAVRRVTVKINQKLLRVLARVVFRNGQAVPWTGGLKAAPA